MLENSLWEVFKVTGNIEAYLTYIEFRAYHHKYEVNKGYQSNRLLEKEAK